ncbi:MAG TPA: hypothetical protein VFS21_25135 [Roseiflexaceae bacterium]|nr:hypothetical protein [Roseiflexaceae bacterium]
MRDTSVSIRVAPRFTRSIHLQRDFGEGGLGISGYQVTPLVRQMLGRVLGGLRPDSAERAFSVVGPYGSGKSAFGVFLASYLSCLPADRASLLAAHGAPPDQAYADGLRLLPVLVGGNTGALRPAVVRALHQSLVRQTSLCHQHPALIERLDALFHDLTVDPQQVAALVDQAAIAVRDSRIADGLLLVIDELGQYLNHIARDGDERDLFVLQTLAETAARSGDHPVLMVTILHQSFDRYTVATGPTRRAEWAKVQGRFAELPFNEPSSQMIRMVARALWPDDQPLPTWQRDWGMRLGAQADKLLLRPLDIAPSEWQQLVARAYPLHPTVLLTLPLLFRQIAQNERSLFAFLTSPEPWGLQDFAVQTPRDSVPRPVYRLPQLYKYVESNLGAALAGRARGRRWAELAEARARLGDMPGLASEALTVIGLLGALGQGRGLRADRQSLGFALVDELDDAQVGVALRLLEERRLITYRKHRQSFQIWEGSDLDLNTLTAQARRDLDNRAALVDLLAAHATPPPLVARRFSYETGAPRLFVARFVDAADLPHDWSPPTNAEGEVLYVVAADGETLTAAERWACDPARAAEALRLAVLPTRTDDLRDLALEVAALEHVLAHEHALEQDGAARRELAARLAEARQALGDLLAYAYGAGQARWFWCSETRPVRDARAVDVLLSAACAAAYPHTPRVWNELIVRRQLSAAATRARRMLVEAMLDHGHEELLGFSGFPPERAIYASVFAASGIHRLAADGSWHFDAPPPDDPLHMRPAWDAIETFFDSTIAGPRPLLDLHRLLEAPPYGVKAGLIPLLFVAAYLANSGEIALYEHSSYAPTPDMPLFERMLRQPSYFAVRRSRVSGVRVAVFERLARALKPQALRRAGHPALLDAVTPLLRLVHGLPPYARTTRELGTYARAVRTALLDARAPDELLFESLPHACDLPPFDAATPADDAAVDRFFARLRGALEELQGAYAALRERVTARITAAFHAAASDPPALHDELSARYAHIVAVTSDTQVRAFGVRIEHGDPSGGWVESVAALVAHKPLDAWNDADATAFDMQIADLGRRFRLVEQLALTAAQLPPDTPLLRVAVADAHGERSLIVNHDQLLPEADALRDELAGVIQKYAGLHQRQRAAAIAALLQTILNEK